MSRPVFVPSLKCHVPDVNILAVFTWRSIADSRIRAAVCDEHQALAFELKRIQNLPALNDPVGHIETNFQKTTYNLRASQIRDLIRKLVSIAEGCLWDHAIQRGWNVPSPNKRNFGQALNVWEQKAGKRPKGLTRCWRSLKEFNKLRNHIHPYSRPDDPRSENAWLVSQQTRLFREIDRALVELSQLTS